MRKISLSLKEAFGHSRPGSSKFMFGPPGQHSISWTTLPYSKNILPLMETRCEVILRAQVKRVSYVRLRPEDRKPASNFGQLINIDGKVRVQYSNPKRGCYGLDHKCPHHMY